MWTWIRRLRHASRETVLALLYYGGALWVALRLRLRGRIVVLTYHRVLPKERWADSFSSEAICVTPETFERQMRFVRRHLGPVDVREFARRIRTGDFPSRGACVVTFDDGWYDTLVFALPILRRHGVPAVLFVPSDFVGSRGGFWQERLTGALWALRDDDALPGIIAAYADGVAVAPGKLRDRRRLREFVTGLKMRPASEVEALLSAVLERLRDRQIESEDRFLDWDGLVALQDSGLVSIGSHGVSHRPMTKLAPDVVRHEVRRSFDALRQRLGDVPSVLAYPNGDASPTVADIARSEGVEIAFTTVAGHVDSGSAPGLIPRINIHEGATRRPWGFLARVVGL